MDRIARKRRSRRTGSRAGGALAAWLVVALALAPAAVLAAHRSPAGGARPPTVLAAAPPAAEMPCEAHHAAAAGGHAAHAAALAVTGSSPLPGLRAPCACGCQDHLPATSPASASLPPALLAAAADPHAPLALRLAPPRLAWARSRRPAPPERVPILLPACV